MTQASHVGGQRALVLECLNSVYAWLPRGSDALVRSIAIEHATSIQQAHGDTCGLVAVVKQDREPIVFLDK